MLDYLFKPGNVAVIGASERNYTLGYQILNNLITNNFQGKIFPINPKSDSILGVKAYPSILDVPDDVDLAHIILKNTNIPGVIEQCGQKKIKVVIVNSAGFSEIGPEGVDLEEKMLQTAAKYGVRVFGPNCQGVMNSDKDVSLYANFTFTPIIPGHISIIAQSGGVGEVINNRLFELQAGIRLYASNGNASDISIPELLRYMGNDDTTRAICLHIESIKDPHAFLEAAQEVTRKKPVLAFKTGRTELGAKAVSSHTGMLVQQDTSMQLIFEKAGIIPFRSHEALCQAARGFASQPLPKGTGVGIITNTGGPAIIATDEVVEAGLNLPELSDKSVSILKTRLHPEASVKNPVDVLATGAPEHFAVCLETLLNEDSIHAILLHFVTPFFVDCPEVARQIADKSKDARKPVLCVAMTNKVLWADTLQILKESGIPYFDFPEVAARVLSNMYEYSRFRSLSAGKNITRPKKLDHDQASRIMSQNKEYSGLLSSADAFALLKAYGIPVPPYRVVRVPDDVAKAADEIGYPIVLKIDSPEISHKSDVGGVVLDIRHERQLTEVLTNLNSRFNIENQAFLVQKYISGGIEIIAGAKAEEGLGHIMMFGLGGIYVEVLQDVSFSLSPLSGVEARSMIESIESYPLLKGVRGQTGVNIEKIEDCLIRLSLLVTDFPRIAEIDLNPISISGEIDRCFVLDARIIID